VSGVARLNLSLCCARLRFVGADFSGRCHFVARVESFLSASSVAAASLLLVRRFCRGWVRLSLQLRRSLCGLSVGFVCRRYFVSRSGSTRVGVSVIAVCQFW
jgi:hypothetical protein